MLTPRQRQFYEALVALCQASGRSVHYTAVAEALGVSPFSAYDMLKVLESKGAVASEYVLDGAASGPGRSSIMFYPSSAASNGRSSIMFCPSSAAPNGRAATTSHPSATAPNGRPSVVFRPRTGLPGERLPAGSPDEAEWPGVKRALLQRLGEVCDANVRDVLGELLARLAEQSSPLSYCTGVVAALLVNLRAGGLELFNGRHLPTLRDLSSAGEVGLGMLAGLSIGSSLGRLREAPSLEALLQPVRRFQVLLSALSVESRQRLAEFLGEALATIEAAQA